MKLSIRKFLRYSIALYGVMVAIMVVALIYIDNQSIQALNSSQLSKATSDGAFSLLMLSNETHISKTDRLLAQWDSKTEQIRALASELGDTRLIDSLSVQRLLASLTKADEAVQQIYLTEPGSFEENQLIFQVSLYLHEVAALASKVKTVAGAIIEQNINYTRWIGISLVISIIFLAFVVFIFFKMGISQPTDKVIDALRRIESDRSQRLPKLNTEELNLIANQVNHSLDALEKISVSRDEVREEVTQRIEAEQKIRETLAQLRDTQSRLIASEKLSALGMFVGGIAHELNNPLMGISNYITYAQNKSPEGKPKEMLGRALEETERITRLVKNLLIYSRSAPDSDSRCDPNQVISRVISVLSGRIRSDHANVIFDSDASLPDIRIDADSLQQIMMNLMVNALDVMATFERGQSRNLELWSEKTESHLKIHMRDSGPGIEGAIRNKIFDPFFTTKPVGQGTGLGLSISAQLAAESGGSLELLPQESDQGAHFLISIKLADIE